MNTHTIRRSGGEPSPRPNLVSRLLIPLTAMLPLALTTPVQANAMAKVVKEVPMKNAPDLAAADVLQLRPDQTVEVRQRQGGWYDISPDGKQQGWVRLLALRFEQAAYRPGSIGVGSLLSVVRTGHSDVTMTTGVRGLTEEQVRQARADLAALDAMKLLVVSDTEAREFAARERLQSYPVDYLEAGQ